MTTRRQLVLEALRDAGPQGCTTGQLCQPDCGGVRFSARIMELREAGAVISATPIRRGAHRYILIRDVQLRAGGASIPPGAASPELGGRGMSEAAPPALFEVEPKRRRYGDPEAA